MIMLSPPSYIAGPSGQPWAADVIGDDTGILGVSGPVLVSRILAALSDTSGLRRYAPSWAPGERSVVGIDLSGAVDAAAGILSASLVIAVNRVPPVVSSDFTIGPAGIIGRVIYCLLAGGVSGTDYVLTWTTVAGDNLTVIRSNLLLCSPTS